MDLDNLGELDVDALGDYPPRAESFSNGFGFEEHNSANAPRARALSGASAKNQTPLPLGPSDRKFTAYITQPTSESEAESYLDDDAVGTFLFRQDKGSRDLFVSVKVKGRGEQKVWHGRVSVFYGVVGGVFTLDPGQGPYFPTLAKFVEFYTEYEGINPQGDVKLLGPLAAGGLSAGKLKGSGQVKTSEVIPGQAGGGGAMIDLDENDPWYQSNEFIALIAVSIYFIAGLVYYTQQLGWSTNKAGYFLFVVLTTIGYGDNDSFDTDEALLFTAFLAFYGVVIVFWGAQILVQYLFALKEAAKNAASKRSLDKVFGADESADQSPDNTQVAVPEPVDPDAPITMADRLRALASHEVMQSFYRFVAALVFGMILVTHIDFKVTEEEVEVFDPITNSTVITTVEGVGPLTGVEAFYWAIITGITVGFGDFSPQTDLARGLAIPYMFTMVIFTADFIGKLNDYLSQGDDLEDALALGLSEGLITTLDADGSGEVTKDEFLRGMLVALDRVDDELCELILKRFDVLDATGDGTLSMADLAAVMDQQKHTQNAKSAKRDLMNYQAGHQVHRSNEHNVVGRVVQSRH